MTEQNESINKDNLEREKKMTHHEHTIPYKINTKREFFPGIIILNLNANINILIFKIKLLPIVITGRQKAVGYII